MSAIFGGVSKQPPVPAPVAPPSTSTAVETARRSAIATSRGHSASILTSELGVSGNRKGRRTLGGA